MVNQSFLLISNKSIGKTVWVSPTTKIKLLVLRLERSKSIFLFFLLIILKIYPKPFSFCLKSSFKSKETSNSPLTSTNSFGDISKPVLSSKI